MSYRSDEEDRSTKRQRASMPVATSTEESVLGFILRSESITQTWQHFASASAMDDESGASTLFFNPAHNAVASAMESIVERGEKITENLLADRLSARGFSELGSDDLNPDDYISWLSIASTSISTLNAMEDAVSVLREHNARRNGITFAEELMDRLHDTDFEMDKIHALLSDGTQDALVASTRRIPGFSDVYDEEMYGDNPSYSVPSGIPSIDASLSGTTIGENPVRGFGAGRTYVLAAGPGVGKTTMMFRFVREAVDSGAIPIVISAESSGADIMAKIISGESGAKFGHILESIESQDDTYAAVEEDYRDAVFAAVEKYQDVGGRSKIKIIQDAQPISMIPSNVMSVRSEAGDNEKIIVFIDYLQLLIEDSRNEREELADMTKELHRIAKNMRVPIVMLSQFTKIEKGARPSITQLYGSSSIEKDSDGIMLAWRPADMDNPEESDDKYANMGFGDSDLLVDLSKNRINKRSGDNVVRLLADYSRCIIEENDESIQDFGGEREYSRRERSDDSGTDDRSRGAERGSGGSEGGEGRRLKPNQSMGSSSGGPRVPKRRSQSRRRRGADSDGSLEDILD